MSMTDSTTMSPSDLDASLQLVTVKPGTIFSLAMLRDFLPDAETLLFFGKVYALDARQLGNLLHTVLATDLTRALFAEGGEHSNELQDYLLDGYYDEEGIWHDPIVGPAQQGDINLTPDVPHGEILPQMWQMLEVTVAKSIAEVAAKTLSVVDRLPGKQGSMIFKSLMKVNARRPTLGDFKAQIHHAPQKQNLGILDVSSSVSRHTVQAIVADFVALSYKANAHFAIVSNTCSYWEPGTYGVDEVMRAAEFSGTQYEQLVPLFDRDWGTVITLADYDSSNAAKQALLKCSGRIDQLLDISLVNRSTYLAECVGQLAASVQPVLIGNSQNVLR